MKREGINDDYIFSLYQPFFTYGYYDPKNDHLPDIGDETAEQMLVGGFQIKLNKSNTLYLPIMFSFGVVSNKAIYVRDVIYKDKPAQEPLRVEEKYINLFAGSGLFINTEKIKGGIYMGWGNAINNTNYYSPAVRTHIYEDFSKNSFKLALVPLVNTSELKYIGKALDYILGYFGLGDALMNFTEKDEDSKSAAAANAINAALDFTFNRIHWGNLSLDMQAMYTRGNFNSAVKADTFGAKLSGLFSGFPFGFSLEGGYKNFYYVSPYFEQAYNNGTGYFDGSIYFPLKRITLGLLYKYDSVYNSQIGVALSTNTFSGFGISGTDNINGVAPYWGLRFRWDGWKAGRQ
jgi:hypothetical protein